MTNNPGRPSTTPFIQSRPMQIGFVVSDMGASLRYWTETLKVAPFIVIKDALAGRRFVHRGVDSDVQFSIAFSYIGDTQIELLAQHNSAASPYTEFLSSGREGMHHMAFGPDDFEESCSELKRAGLAEVCSIHMPDGTKNVSYFAGASHLGAMVEIWPMTPLRKQYFAGIKAFVETWDGTGPIREFELRTDFLQSREYKALTEKNLV